MLNAAACCASVGVAVVGLAVATLIGEGVLTVSFGKLIVGLGRLIGGLDMLAVGDKMAATAMTDAIPILAESFGA
jgi:hypothetical protein